MGATPQEDMNKRKDMTDAGLDIIGGGIARKNWEELQLDIKEIEPETMKRRKLEDQILRDKERKSFEGGEITSLPTAYAEPGFILVKKLKKQLGRCLSRLRGGPEALSKCLDLLRCGCCFLLVWWSVVPLD